MKLDTLFSNRSVHYIINFIKNWDMDLGFFINAKIRLSFESLNKNRLKNIFFFFIKDRKIWGEVLKMINLHIIDFSPKLLLSRDGFYSFNLLSWLLFDIYFTELDIYMLNLSYKFNSKRISMDKFDNQLNLLDRKSKYINYLLPLRLNKRTINFAVFFKKKNKSSVVLKSFLKKINYVRYMNFFLVGLVGSKVLALKVKRKLFSFVRGNLHFSLNYCDIFSILESQNFFLGYQIRCAFLFLIYI